MENPHSAELLCVRQSTGVLRGPSLADVLPASGHVLLLVRVKNRDEITQLCHVAEEARLVHSTVQTKTSENSHSDHVYHALGARRYFTGSLTIYMIT